MNNKFSGLSEGVPAGLRWALFFLICFYLLGCSAVFSVLLAVVGGVAISLVVDWWKSKDELLNQMPDKAAPNPNPVTQPIKDAIARLGLKRPTPPEHLNVPFRSHRPRVGPRRLISRRHR